MKSLPKRLKQWRGVTGKGRKARGKFSQVEAARLLGVPFGSYLQWENGRHTPTGFALQAIIKRIK